MNPWRVCSAVLLAAAAAWYGLRIVRIHRRLKRLDRAVDDGQGPRGHGAP